MVDTIIFVFYRFRQEQGTLILNADVSGKSCKLLQLSSHITYGSRGIIPVMVGQLDFLGRIYFLALSVYYVGINKDVFRKKVTGTAAVLYKK